MVGFAAKRDAALFARSRHGLVARGVLELDELARSIGTTDQRQRLILRDCNLGAAVHDECLAAHSLVHRDGAVLICGGVEIRTAESDVLRRLVEVEIGQLFAGNIDQGAGKFKLARVQNGLSILRVNDVVLAVSKRERTAFKYEPVVLERTRIDVQAIRMESILEDLVGGGGKNAFRLNQNGTRAAKILSRQRAALSDGDLRTIDLHVLCVEGRVDPEIVVVRNINVGYKRAGTGELEPAFRAFLRDAAMLVIVNDAKIHNGVL